MSDPLVRLRALVAESFLAVPAGKKPEAHAMSLSADLDAGFAALLAEKAPIPFDELTTLAHEFRDRSRTLPEAVERAHFDWLRITKRWYKLVLGPNGEPRAPDLPPGTPSVPLVLVPHFYDQITELRYALHRREHPAACDCAALRDCKRYREPRSPDLRALGETNDGYYFGDAFLCGACGARWFRGIGDDDHGSIFWEPDANT